MLLNDFYSIIKHEHTSGSLRVQIDINKNHQIFKGHFPGHPVVPGVCMLQIVREVMEVHTGKKLAIAGADNMKFLAIVNPEQNKEVEVNVNYTEENGKFTVNATLFAGTVTFFKLKATLQPAG